MNDKRVELARQKLKAVLHVYGPDLDDDVTGSLEEIAKDLTEALTKHGERS